MNSLWQFSQLCMVRFKTLNPFVQTREMNNVIAIAQQFHLRPSDVAGLQTELGKYCFDLAAVAYIRFLEEDKTPRYPGDEKSNPGLQMLMG